MKSKERVLRHRTHKEWMRLASLTSSSTRNQTSQSLSNLSEVSHQKVMGTGLCDFHALCFARRTVLPPKLPGAPNEITSDFTTQTSRSQQSRSPFFVLFLSFQLLRKISGWRSKPPTLQTTANNIIKHRKRLIVVSLLLNNEGQGMPKKLMGTLGWVSDGSLLRELWAPGLGYQAPCLAQRTGSIRVPPKAAGAWAESGHLPDDQVPLSWVVNERYLARKNSGVLTAPSAKGRPWLILFNPQNIPK